MQHSAISGVPIELAFSSQFLAIVHQDIIPAEHYFFSFCFFHTSLFFFLNCDHRRDHRRSLFDCPRSLCFFLGRRISKN